MSALIEGSTKVFVSGGAGFIGSHVVTQLLGNRDVERLVVFDNFRSGKRSHLKGLVGDKRLEIIEDDLKEIAAIKRAMAGCKTVIHLAANSDIAKGCDPTRHRLLVRHLPYPKYPGGDAGERRAKDHLKWIGKFSGEANRFRSIVTSRSSSSRNQRSVPGKVFADVRAGRIPQRRPSAPGSLRQNGSEASRR